MNKCFLQNKELFSSLLFPLSKIEFNTDSRVWVFFAENEKAGTGKKASIVQGW